MPRPTPLFPRTHELCTSLLYKDWSGCHAVRRYDTYHEREYYALRQAATLMDVTPLYKYEVRGPDAGRLLSRVMVRGFVKAQVGRVGYVCWCDGDGKVLDDGTVTRLADDHYRVTSAEPSQAWLERHSRGLRVTVEDVSRAVAALSLQGPRSRTILREVVGPEVDQLGFFRAMPARFGAHGGVVTRTGYTGDLGYELWVENDGALALWDRLMEVGRPHGLLPMGLDALDVARVEAGFVLQSVDYVSARVALIDQQASSPYELGFDWMVKLERPTPFVGRGALAAEKAKGTPRRLVGLVLDWTEFEALHDALELPPHVATETNRDPVPVYDRGVQIGQATSRTWSPLLKRYLALATVRAPYSRPGTEVSVEVTVEYERKTVAARVTPLPFYDPERKKA